MLDKTDRQLLDLLQRDGALSLQALADAVNLTTTPCWKRLKKLEDDSIIRARVALLDGDKLGLSLTAFMFVKTQQHSRYWYQCFVAAV
nr:Cysteine synthase [Candidatus Pantoea persica]